MENTFHGGNITYTTKWQQYSDGEFILVDKMTYRVASPDRGDVVVFTPWIGPEKRYLIKRVIGIPGDTVKIENGYVSLATSKNPEKFIQLDESAYLEEKYGYTCLTYNSAWCAKESQTFTVPAGRYFLMGDNRPQSLDARKCFSNSGCNGEYTMSSVCATFTHPGTCSIFSRAFWFIHSTDTLSCSRYTKTSDTF
jgi:signal peptidase I